MIWLAIVFLVVLGPGAYKIYYKWGLKHKVFFAQIQKLVMANNIDRAIKLCNAAPHSPHARGLKMILIRANKGAVEIGKEVTHQLLEFADSTENGIPGPLFLWKWKLQKMYRAFAVNASALERLLVERASRR